MDCGPSRTARWDRGEASRRGRARRRLGIVLAGGAAVGALAAAGATTPWPASMLIRLVFELDSLGRVRELDRHAPRTGVVSRADLDLGGDRPDTRCDLFLPADATAPRPVVIWIHGGAWISGSKRDVAPYLRILAGQGYAAVGLNYSLGPERSYPTAIDQLNRAVTQLARQGGELGIDASRIILAGDSAGAQLASQLATVITNPHYARLTGLTPTVGPGQLRGVILHCGVYDLDALATARGIAGWGFRTALWSYSGARNWTTTAAGAEMSTIRHVTRDFPATFISGGDADALTATQSVPLARRLGDLGVDVTARFFTDDHAPGLGHEYQFRLAGAEARATLAATLTFLADRTGS